VNKIIISPKSLAKIASNPKSTPPSDTMTTSPAKRLKKIEDNFGFDLTTADNVVVAGTIGVEPTESGSAGTKEQFFDSVADKSTKFSFVENEFFKICL